MSLPMMSTKRFQSTPSTRGGDKSERMTQKPKSNFNPLPLREGETREGCQDAVDLGYFNPLPLREGETYTKQQGWGVRVDFNPLPLREGETLIVCCSARWHKFQSTPPA